MNRRPAARGDGAGADPHAEVAHFRRKERGHAASELPVSSLRGLLQVGPSTGLGMASGPKRAFGGISLGEVSPPAGVAVTDLRVVLDRADHRRRRTCGVRRVCEGQVVLMRRSSGWIGWDNHKPEETSANPLTDGNLVMTTVKNILRTKGSVTLSADPSLPVREALTRMMDNNVGSLLVIHDGQLVGLLTERDLARASCRQRGDLPGRRRWRHDGPGRALRISGYHERGMHGVDDRSELRQTVFVLKTGIGGHREHRRHHRETATEDKEFMIKQLERYITGR